MMSDGGMYVIDRINQLGIPSAEVRGLHGNELGSLKTLAVGLTFLNSKIEKIEAEVIGRLPDNDESVKYGNAPLLDGLPMELVACACHWYSVSACNYVRLVGWLVTGGDTAKAADYLKQILPEVYLWRNKVGAHFARSDPRKDTLADLKMSVMFPISWQGDAFYAGAMTLTVGSQGNLSSSSNDMRWSLTNTHRQLHERYSSDGLGWN